MCHCNTVRCYHKTNFAIVTYLIEHPKCVVGRVCLSI